MGTLLGNLMGMRPLHTVLAVFVGTFTSTLIIACFAGTILDIFSGGKPARMYAGTGLSWDSKTG